MCRVDLVGENHKSFSSTRPSQPDNYECAVAHIARSVWQTFRQKSERIVGAEMFARHPHCNVAMSDQCDIEWNPLVPDIPLMFVQRLRDIGTNARKVNVQLILRAAHNRVDCQTNVISPKGQVQRVIDMRSNFPGTGEIVRRVWPANGRALDARNSSGRNKQELTASPRVPYYRESIFDSSGQIDLKTGSGIVMQGLSWDAYIMNNFPQCVAGQFSLSRIGCKQYESCTQANRQRSQ